MIWFVMLGLYFGCSSSGSAPQKTGGYTVNYQEDLSVHRAAHEYKTAEATTPASEPTTTSTSPEAMLAVNHDITGKLEMLLDEVAEKNQKIKSIPGFTVQVYSGTSREMAKQVERQVFHVITDNLPEIIYVQPNYKVQVGSFVERLEAQKTYSLLKKEFPTALIIPTRIQINK